MHSPDTPSAASKALSRSPGGAPSSYGAPRAFSVRRAQQRRPSACPTDARIPLVFSAIAALALAACGPPPDAQKPDPGASSADATVVVPLPEPTSAASSVAQDPPDPGPAPSRPAVAAGPVEPCIAKLRDEADLPDPTKASGSTEYRAALAAERSGTLDAARKGYFSVIQRHPDSTLVPAAYFAFGEMFAADAKTDPSKTMLAEQSYKEALKYPYPASRFGPVTHYRLGQIHARGKPQEALAAFMKAAKTDPSTSKDACAAEVSAAALEASIDMYAAVGNGSKSWDFYLRTAGDAGRAADATVKLAERFAAAKKGADARDVLVASTEAGAKAQQGDAAKSAYCKRVKSAADGARMNGGAGATLDQAVQKACP